MWIMTVHVSFDDKIFDEIVVEEVSTLYQIIHKGERPTICDVYTYYVCIHTYK